MKHVAIIGAGPAGLTAGYMLAKGGQQVTVFEKSAEYVGGISRTEKYKGFHFDIGGHRFFSKSKEVEDFWTEMLGDQMLQRPRKSRIFYGGKFYSYPLRAFEALTNLGVLQAASCILSYGHARAFPKKNPTNLEDWVRNEFGSKLYRTFFKTYTEKVWGIDCKDISADWAAQRIKGLKLSTAIINALRSKKRRRKSAKRGAIIKTLIDSFRYPKYGPGQMWEETTRKMKALGGEIVMGRSAKSLQYHSGEDRPWELAVTDERGNETSARFDAIISTMPLRELINAIKNEVPEATLEAADSLKYRDFLTVVLIMRDKEVFDDNWIYIHEPNVKVGRIQNFKSWSPYMVPDPQYACYGLEYFCFEGDGLWNSRDEDLIELGKREMAQIGLANTDDVIDGHVVRQSKAYPVYDEEYKLHIALIRKYIDTLPGLYLAGRNGMHKYNNQDHSMMTAMLAARNILSGRDEYDLWNVNEDAEYHESGSEDVEHSFDAGRATPKKIVRP